MTASFNRHRADRGMSRARSLTVRELRSEATASPAAMPEVPRPRTRGDCLDMERPCPWIACKHNLYLDVSPITGTITINFPALEPWELAETCALDVAERGGLRLVEIGRLLNVTRERVRQIELRALHQLHGARFAAREGG